MVSAVVEFGEWLPDQAALNSAGVTECKGVFAAARGYRPFPQLQPVTDALPARALGGISVKNTANAASTFVGTAAALYNLNGAAWSDVSQTGGYNGGAASNWRFAQFGKYVIGTNGSDKPQSWDVTSSTAFADISAAPVAKHVAVIRDFLFLGNLDGTNPNRVQWSEIDDPTSWPTPGTTAAAEAQSDFQDVPNGGWVTGLCGAVGGTDGLVFMERAIYRVQYEGPPTIFGFYEVEHSRGCLTGNSIVNIGTSAFFLAEDGFYACNGQSIQPIGAEKVNRWFFDTVDLGTIDRLSASFDPFNQLVFWAFPTVASAGVPAAVLMFHWTTGRWSWSEASLDVVFPDFPAGYTLDQLDTLYGSLDAMTISLDSRAWQAGRLSSSAIDSDHKLARFQGLPSAATLETLEMNGDDRGRRLFVKGVRPLVDGATATAAVTSRSSLASAPTTSAEATADADGVCHFRVSARYPRARVSIAADQEWTHAVGCEIDAVPEGHR